MQRDSVLFVRDGDDVVVPTGHARGPWADGRLHGGAVAGLFAELFEAARPSHQEIGALRIELLGPVPDVALRHSVSIARSGRKVSVFDATLSSGSTVHARATATTVGPSSRGGPDAVAPTHIPPPGAGVPAPDRVAASSPFFGAIEYRQIDGVIGEAGPASVWCRVLHRWFAETEPTPLARLMAVADSAYGYGLPVTTRDWLVTNVDLSVHLHRQPVGDWIHFAAAADINASGIGVGYARLADTRGSIGAVAQLVVASPADRRTK